MYTHGEQWREFVVRIYLVVFGLILGGCSGDYFEPNPVVRADCQDKVGRVNAGGVEMEAPVSCSQSDAATVPESGSFPVTKEMAALLRVVRQSERFRDAGMWAHCDPSSTYPDKDPRLCVNSSISIAVDDD